MRSKTFYSRFAHGKILSSYLDAFLAKPTKRTLLTFAMFCLPQECILCSFARPNMSKIRKVQALSCIQCPLFGPSNPVKQSFCPRSDLLEQWDINSGMVILKLTQLRALKEIVVDGP
jgi:hypothetical protein